MAKYKYAIILVILLSMIFSVANATDVSSPKNLEIVQLTISENNEGILSVYYGYPINSDMPKIEKEDLIADEFTLSVSELTINNIDRYAVLYCSISYTNMDDLMLKIQKISKFETQEYKTTLFNFYVLLDSIANNLNFTAIESGVVSLTIDTSSFTNQKYYITHLDSAAAAKLENVDTKTVRNLETTFHLIVPSNIGVSNSEQFVKRELTDVYSEYSCSLNNQKLSITLSQTVNEEPPITEESEFETKINAFLNSKYFNLFVVGCCLFIVIAIIIMIVVARSYTKVIEKEEKRQFDEERNAHDANAPKLYWSKDERELANKKKNLLKNPNALVRDDDLELTESIETSQYRRQSNFK